MRNIYHDKDKLVRAVRKESTKANASLFVISDLTARFLHPRYPPRSTRYEKECRRSGTYTRDDGRYFVGKKKIINFCNGVTSHRGSFFFRCNQSNNIVENKLVCPHICQIRSSK